MREFVGGKLAHEDAACRMQTLRDDAVLGRDIVQQQLRMAGRANGRRVVKILQSVRDAMKRAAIVACGELAVGATRIFKRALNVMIVTITVGLALMTFDSVRQFGVSLFASAGVAGIVVGLAAQPLLGNLLAGMQIAITQPALMWLFIESCGGAQGERLKLCG